jgi:hypothetical protein
MAGLFMVLKYLAITYNYIIILRDIQCNIHFVNRENEQSQGRWYMESLLTYEFISQIVFEWLHSSGLRKVFKN